MAQLRQFTTQSSIETPLWSNQEHLRRHEEFRPGFQEAKFRMNKRNINAILLAFALVLFAAGCKKKVPPPPPPVEKPAAKPVVSTFVAEPSSIQRGQSATLRWKVDNATEVSIDRGIGAVHSSGDRKVFPISSTTYTLTAKGAGGSATATARANVMQPSPPPPPPRPPICPTPRPLAEVSDAYFDYDQSSIRDDARSVLTRNAVELKAVMSDFPNAVIMLEGHCDERGSAEYNLGLGDRRATAVKEFLVELGVSASRLRTISYGKERQQCKASDETCWQSNRRVHFSAGQVDR
jgi:peptidoglycan-associated lipoprotein